MAESVRNVAAVGAVPIALTDCLNFGSPEVPEVFHDFVEAVRGIGDAARGIGMKDSDDPVPIVSGNVSFYNQSSSGSAILPSPVVCCVGHMADFAKHLTTGIKSSGNALYLMGERHGELGASEFARTVLGDRGSDVARVRFDEERAMCAAVTDLAGEVLLESCHDVSDGGLAAAVVEMLLLAAPDATGGAAIEVGWESQAVAVCEAARLLFCENGGYVLEVRPEHEEAVRALLRARWVWFRRVGETTRVRTLAIGGIEGGAVEIDVSELARAWTRGATEVMT